MPYDLNNFLVPASNILPIVEEIAVHLGVLADDIRLGRPLPVNLSDILQDFSYQLRASGL